MEPTKDKIVDDFVKDVRISEMKFISSDDVMFSASAIVPEATNQSNQSKTKKKAAHMSNIFPFASLLVFYATLYMPVSVEGFWLWDIFQKNFSSTEERAVSVGDVFIRRVGNNEQCARFADLFKIIGGMNFENEFCDSGQDSMFFESWQEDDVVMTCPVRFEYFLWSDRDGVGECSEPSADFAPNHEIRVPMDFFVSLDNSTSPTRYHYKSNQYTAEEYSPLPSFSNLSHEVKLPEKSPTIFDVFTKQDSGHPGIPHPFAFVRDDVFDNTSQRIQEIAMDSTNLLQCKITNRFTLVDNHEVMLGSEMDVSMGEQGETQSLHSTILEDETISSAAANESSQSNATMFARLLPLPSSEPHAPHQVEPQCVTNCEVFFKIRIKVKGKSKHPDSELPSTSHRWYVSLRDITDGSKSAFYEELPVKLRCKRTDVTDRCNDSDSAENCKIKGSFPYTCRSGATTSIPFQSLIWSSEFQDERKLSFHYDRIIMATLQSAEKSALIDRRKSLSDEGDAQTLRKIVAQWPVNVAIPREQDDTGEHPRKQTKYTQLIYPIDLNGMNVDSSEVGDKSKSSKEYSFWYTVGVILQWVAGVLSPFALLALVRNSSKLDLDFYRIAISTEIEEHRNPNLPMSNGVGPMGGPTHQEDPNSSVENHDVVEDPTNKHGFVVQQSLNRPYDSIDKSCSCIDPSPTPLRNNITNLSPSPLREIEQESEQSEVIVGDTFTTRDGNQSSRTLSGAGRLPTPLNCHGRTAEATTPIVQTRVCSPRAMHHKSVPESPPQIERNNSNDLFSETAVPGNPAVLGDLLQTTSQKEASETVKKFPLYNESASNGEISRENDFVKQQISCDVPNPESNEGTLWNSGLTDMSERKNFITDSITGSSCPISISGIDNNAISPQPNHESRPEDQLLPHREVDNVSLHLTVDSVQNELKPVDIEVVNHRSSNNQTEQLNYDDNKSGQMKRLMNLSGNHANEISPLPNSQSENEEASRIGENTSEEDDELLSTRRSCSGLGGYHISSLGVNHFANLLTKSTDASFMEHQLGGGSTEQGTSLARILGSAQPLTCTRKQESRITYTGEQSLHTETYWNQSATNSDDSNDQTRPIDTCNKIRAEPLNASDIPAPGINRWARQSAGNCPPSPTSTIAATTAEFAVQRRNLPVLGRQHRVINERPSPIPCGDVRQGQRKRFAISATDALKPSGAKHENSRRRSSSRRRNKNGSDRPTEDVPTDHSDQRSKNSGSNLSEIEPRRKSTSKNSSAEKKLLALSKVSGSSNVKVPSALIPLAEEMQRPVWQL